ncbi:putative Nuclear hormone receptor E75 [Hypsibius exemplaris]|uniref:Nuclear hormone receptor E75 n=1 Tax=Hypsibius exemplaris TaxID=2072580 RepID=A0A1W0XDM9_HYPEX|nr:putative Nuclear hormone receptor E75 [Hypsibius exemplaris]
MTNHKEETTLLPRTLSFMESPCRVCKSPSTGVHYGVTTCEGCKGFFKRSIPKSQHYKCFFGGNCEITRDTRNRCKSCRFQRCLQVGMALEAVKMGRIPKKEKEREAIERDNATRNRVVPDLTSVPNSENREGINICGPSASEAVDIVVQTWQAGRLTEDTPLDPNVTPLRIRDCLETVLTGIMARVYSFMEKIPGFSDLNKSDATLLVEQSIFEIWMVRNAAFLVNNESYIMLQLPGVERPLHYTRALMSNFMSNTMINAMMAYADEMNSCQLSFLELNIFRTIIVLCSERVGLQDRNKVQKLCRIMHEVMLQAFKRRSGASTADEMYTKFKSVLAHLSRKLSEIVLNDGFVAVPWLRFTFGTNDANKE